MAAIGFTLVTKSILTEAEIESRDAPIAASNQSYEDQFKRSMLAEGVSPPKEIVFDGKLRRYATGDKRGDKSGWYVAYDDGVPAGSFGDWRTMGEGSLTWRADIGRRLTYAEECSFAARQADAKRARDAENAAIKLEGAARAKERWDSASTECMAHPYLTKKGLAWNPGWRMTPDGRLVSPMLIAGEVVGTQSIDADGRKQFDFGSTAAGAWLAIGPLHGDTERVYIAEGVATAASIAQATHKPVAVAYSASNLPATAKAVRECVSAGCEIVIVADTDGPDGVGWRWAQIAAKAVQGCRAVSVPVPEGWEGGKIDANDYATAGHDLKALLEPMATAPAQEWLVPADDWSSQPAPIKWLVKHWIQEQALIMVHGPSGGGKTFVVLDMLLRIASGDTGQEWAGKRVKPGAVVYLAGEGGHGLRARIAGWKDKHQVEKLNMWLSRSGCDLNTPEGYLKVVDAIKKAGIAPSIIAVDTLHRFLLGDENKAQDAKTMLDACAGLMEKFGCSVLLVHHTGVNEESQHRARGSSAWRGALDIEISVTPAKDGKPMEIVQRKSKDSEIADTVYATLERHDIPGWLDEDGDQVNTAILSHQAGHVPADGDDEPQGKAKKATAAETALHGHKQTMREAWQHSGSETVVIDGACVPYVTRSALLKYLTTECGKTDKTAKNSIAPNGDVMKALKQNGFCYTHDAGWAITDNKTPEAGDGAGASTINTGAIQASAANKNSGQV